MDKINIYNETHFPKEEQIKIFDEIVYNFVSMNENGKLVFNNDTPLDDNNKKSLIKFTFLVDRVKKMIKMLEEDDTLYNIEFDDLWEML